MADGGRIALDLTGAYAHDDVVLVDHHDVIDAAAFGRAVEEFIGALPNGRKLLVLVDQPRSSWRRLAAYVGVLAAGHTACFVDGMSRARASAMMQVYRPDVVVADETTVDLRHDEAPLHPQLALLMWSSGTTGQPKAVRLSYDNIAANSRAIAHATGIAKNDRVATTLPMDYSFGLSLVNSHLDAGAAIALTSALPSSDRCTYDLTTLAATTIGVTPGTATVLASRPRALPPGVRDVLVAGGRTPASTLHELDRRLRPVGGKLHSMYGQTEATARISCLPAALVARRADSVGIPIDDCTLRVLDASGSPVADGLPGEIEVSGASVMLGYARSRDDCARGDDCAGIHRTGDVGCIVDGLLYIEGRVDRQVKVFGRAIDLDMAERATSKSIAGACAAVVVDDILVVTIETAGTGAAATTREVDPTAVGVHLADELGLPRSVVRVRTVDKLPTTATGKIDHTELARSTCRVPT